MRGEFEGTPLYTIPLAGWASGLGLEADRTRAAVRPGSRPALRRSDTGLSCLPPLSAGPWCTRSTRFLGDEVERDRLGRGLVFRTYRAIEGASFAMPPP